MKGLGHRCLKKCTCNSEKNFLLEFSFFFEGGGRAGPVDSRQLRCTRGEAMRGIGGGRGGVVSAVGSPMGTNPNLQTRTFRC